MAPYRGWIAKIEMIKNIVIFVTGIVFLVIAAIVGMLTENPLWGALLAIFWIGSCIIGVYFLK